MAQLLPKLQVTDLLAQARTTSIRPIRGRTSDMEQVARSLKRRSQHNLIISGPRGIGKTALIEGFIQKVRAKKFTSLRPLPYVQVASAQLAALLRDTQKKEEMLNHIAAAFQSLPGIVVVIDEADLLLEALDQPWQFEHLLAAFFTNTQRHLVLVVSEEALENLRSKQANCFKYFDVLKLPELSAPTCHKILRDHAPRLSAQYDITIEPSVITAIVETMGNLPLAGALPRRAINFFEDVCAAAVLEHQAQVTAEHVHYVAAQRLRLPKRALAANQKAHLQQLATRLQQQVIGQDHAATTVAQTVIRGRLGLKNPNRPIGSFLFLGPSGVGKTEFAKSLAREVFGEEATFIRLDMSEYAEAHNVQRLVGAPPGYVGYEAGGQLTKPIQQQPYSLILLDEIEKADSGVFDIFLQILDDGRLTDGHGTTVDFTHTILIATSNIGSLSIAESFARGVDISSKQFLDTTIMPLLLQKFRPEFINRLEDVITFKPLTPDMLYEIAQLEMRKIEQRLQHHHVQLQIDEAILRQKIAELYDPRFGARPIKRFIEQLCESALAERLLTH